MDPSPSESRPSRRRFLHQTAGGLMLAATSEATAWPPHKFPEDDEAYWKLVRSQFPLTSERTYMNAGGLGPAPHPVLQTVHNLIDDLQSTCEHGHAWIEKAREPAAAFFGVSPTEIAFMRNATEGNATVAAGLDLQSGDEVIFESHAHPGGSFGWMNRQKRDDIRVRVFDPQPATASDILQKIRDLITPRTRIIQVSHVTAPTGIHMPVEGIARLAHEHNLWFHVDGAQSAGMIPVDLAAIGCDSYATSGHKWMGGPLGSGILYVREQRLDEVTPGEIGAYSESSYSLPGDFEYHSSARRFEPGTRDAASVAGLEASMEFLDTIGMQRIADYARSLADRVRAGLNAMPDVTVLTPADPSLSASITTFRSERMPYDELYGRLVRDYQIRCRIVNEQNLNAIRVSTHLFNNPTECDRLLEAIGEILQG
ncbi:MAG: aminotransferase class V-fold PLP-dependent enzyme [Pirellulaceae bacterium]